MLNRFGLASLLAALLIASVTTGAERAPASLPSFVIKELTPQVDPVLKQVKPVYMCADPRVHYTELEPSPLGGVTETRVAVRTEKPGSSYVILLDQEPGYRMYQVFTRGFIVRALAWAGAEHVFMGTVAFGGYTFESDPSFPFHFKLVENVGYVHLSGLGTITTPSGEKHVFAEAPAVDALLARLQDGDSLQREGACEALGYLVRTPADRMKAVPVLVKALQDHAMEVRRNAAEALGRMGDPGALEALKAAVQDENDWVREVAVHAIEQISTGQDRE